MKPRFPLKHAIIFVAIDALMVMAALSIADFLTRELVSSFPSYFDPPGISLLGLNIYILVAVVWVSILIWRGGYDPEKNLRFVDEFYNLLIVAMVSGMVTSGIFYIMGVQLYRPLFVIFTLIALMLILLYRSIFLLAYNSPKTSPNIRVMIAGAGKVGRDFEDKIKKYQAVGYQFIGYVDDNPDLIKDHPDILGNVEDAIDLIQEYNINHLVIALPSWSIDRINFLVDQVRTLPVKVWVIPDYFALILSKSSVWNFAGMPMINLHNQALNSRQRLIKRIFDLAFSIPMLVLTLPLFCLIALLIKLDSKGPVYYHSIRLKENCKPFKMVKFRTMVQHAHNDITKVIRKDQNGDVLYKMRDDPRVTRMGRFLRRTSLDELPQLINIIKGEMSLVGPRPELPEMVNYYKPWQYRRFVVPQGLTGWWQVNGRSDKPMHLHTEDDLYYIQNYSFALDIQILLRTPFAAIRGKGAY
jgi:exopolysaccharide biosynthesis polyprenyl glycosylphosphotransferase